MRPSQRKPRSLLFCLTAAGALGWALLPAATLGQTPAPAGPIDGLAAWDKIAAVMQHPRCLNCHQLETPLRGDARRSHVPRVVRGPDDRGASAMRCANCHSLGANNTTSGVPGAPDWALARSTMSWQGLSRGELCRTLKNPRLNGNRSPEALIEHFEHDRLALWAWNPGSDREPIPIPYREFLDLVRAWVANGLPCPA
jgi:hypothetical protein